MFKLELVAPKGKVFQQDVYMVVVPSVSGVAGILTDHAPIVAVLQHGVIAAYQSEDKITDKFFVSGGMIEFSNNHCHIICDAVHLLSDLRIEQVNEKISLLRKKLNHSEEKENRDLYRDEIKIFKSMLQVLEKEGS